MLYFLICKKCIFILSVWLIAVCCEDAVSVVVFGSRPSDHYFRSVCWFVCLFCLFVCAEFFSAVFDLILMKLRHMLHVWV